MKRALVLAVLFADLTACSASSTTPEPPSTPTSTTAPAKRSNVPAPLVFDHGAVVVTGTDGVAHRFAVELAVTDKERQRGLMYRESLAEDAGMLFLFEEQRQLSFWMQNTWIPLDMVFIDEDLVVKGIVEDAEPMTTTSRQIKGPTRFVLEIQGGLSRKLGLGAGAKVQFEGVRDALWQKKSTTATPTP